VTRVIAGEARGRRLAVPGGLSTRPTSDRAREGLFGTVVSELGSLAGRRVLDLFAGSGAVGLEALSRGASHVLLVESDARAVAVIRANIEIVGLPGAQARGIKAERLLASPPQGAPYEFVFLDPPYALADAAVTRILSQLGHGWLAPGALVVVERATRAGEVSWPEGLQKGKSRRYGEATFWYGRQVAAGDKANAMGSESAAAAAPREDPPSPGARPTGKIEDIGHAGGRGAYE
jgi:16S rRNA (guanine966-N2)-methyltransferase